MKCNHKPQLRKFTISVVQASDGNGWLASCDNPSVDMGAGETWSDALRLLHLRMIEAHSRGVTL